MSNKTEDIQDGPDDMKLFREWFEAMTFFFNISGLIDRDSSLTVTTTLRNINKMIQMNTIYFQNNHLNLQKLIPYNVDYIVSTTLSENTIKGNCNTLYNLLCINKY